MRYDKEAGCSKRPDNTVNILRYWIFVNLPSSLLHCTDKMSISLSSELFLTPTVRIKMKNLLLLSASFLFFSYILTLKPGERSVTKSSKSSSLKITDTGSGLIFSLSNSEGVGKTETQHCIAR